MSAPRKAKTEFGIEVRVFTAQTGMTVKELAEKAGVKYTTLVETTTGRCAGHQLTHCYLVMNQNPEGCFTTAKGKAVDAKEATVKLDKMAQSLGELIDRENELLKGAAKSTAQQKQKT